MEPISFRQSTSPQDDSVSQLATSSYLTSSLSSSRRNSLAVEAEEIRGSYWNYWSSNSADNLNLPQVLVSSSGGPPIGELIDLSEIIFGIGLFVGLPIVGILLAKKELH